MHKYKHGDIFTFANGMIGCLTERGKLALISPKGYTYPATKLPIASEYMAKHEMIQWERPFRRHSDEEHIYRAVVMWKRPEVSASLVA